MSKLRNKLALRNRFWLAAMHPVAVGKFYVRLWKIFWPHRNDIVLKKREKNQTKVKPKRRQ